jgi:molybdenum cofactor synthesis domain-containing protein
VAVELITAGGFDVVATVVVPDESAEIEAALTEASLTPGLIVTTGGTGLGPRDVTPEATLAVIDREAPGLAEAMRSEGMRHNRRAALSRGVAGSIGNSLVLNLPGSTAGVKESLDAVMDILPHALELLAGNTEHGHSPPHQGT